VPERFFYRSVQEVTVRGDDSTRKERKKKQTLLFPKIFKNGLPVPIGSVSLNLGFLQPGLVEGEGKENIAEEHNLVALLEMLLDQRVDHSELFRS
jgi:hypothetical protein